MHNHPIHPAATIFPEMSAAEIDALALDIAAHGLRDPIVIYDGQVLDGRHRQRACAEAGVEPRYVEWDGNGTPEAFVLSKNLHRRHLSASQRAMIAARLANLPYGIQKKHQTQKRNPSTTLDEAAAIMNVGKTTVTEARVVQVHGTPEQIRAVDNGDVSVTRVAKDIGIAKLRRNATRHKALEGKNPERIQNQQMRAEIWRQVRETLTHLTSLPDPADVARIVRGLERGGLVDTKLDRAQTWLGAFADAWKRRDETAA